MKDDKELTAAIIGGISTIPTEILTQIFVKVGITKYSIFTLASMLITLNRPSLIVGIFVSPVVAGVIAVLLFHVFRILGSQHLIIKCTAVSILMWSGLELIFTATIEDRLINIRPISSYYGHLVGAIIFGIIEGFLFKRYLFHNVQHSKY